MKMLSMHNAVQRDGVSMYLLCDSQVDARYVRHRRACPAEMDIINGVLACVGDADQENATCQ